MPSLRPTAVVGEHVLSLYRILSRNPDILSLDMTGFSAFPGLKDYALQHPRLVATGPGVKRPPWVSFIVATNTLIIMDNNGKPLTASLVATGGYTHFPSQSALMPQGSLDLGWISRGRT
jgi:hypothetical protein